MYYHTIKMLLILKVFLRTLQVLQFKCCNNNTIIVPCSHWRRPPVTRKWLPVWHLETTSGKQMQESCQRLWQLLEAAAGCLRGQQYDRKCTFYFNCYFSSQLQQTETSDGKLCIFQSGHNDRKREASEKGKKLEKCIHITSSSTWSALAHVLLALQHSHITWRTGGHLYSYQQYIYIWHLVS